MSKLLINATKRPGAILVMNDGSVFGYKEEDLTFRGTSRFPTNAIAELMRLNNHVRPDEAFINQRTDNAGYSREYSEIDGILSAAPAIVSSNNIKHLATSAAAWCSAQIEELNRRNLRPENLDQPTYVIATAMFSQDQTGFWVYRLEADSELQPVYTGRGYLANLELYLNVLGVPNTPEERERFEARAIAEDVTCARNAEKIGATLRLLLDRIFDEANAPTLIESHNDDINRTAFGEAREAIGKLIDTELAKMDINDTQAREGVRSRLADLLVGGFVGELRERFNAFNLILVGAAFHDKRANWPLSLSLPGFLSVAPFDVEDGVLLHMLPADTLAGDMRIGPVKGMRDFGEQRIAKDILPECFFRGADVISEDLCFFNTVSLDSLCLNEADDVTQRYYACECCDEQPYKGWTLVHRNERSKLMRNVIGSQRFGLVGNVLEHNEREFSKLNTDKDVECRPFYLSGDTRKKAFTQYEIDQTGNPLVLE